MTYEQLTRAENPRVERKRQLLENPRLFVHTILEGMPCEIDDSGMRTTFIGCSVDGHIGTMTEGELRILAERIKTDIIESEEYKNLPYFLDGKVRWAMLQDVRDVLTSLISLLSSPTVRSRDGVIPESLW